MFTTTNIIYNNVYVHKISIEVIHSVWNHSNDEYKETKNKIYKNHSY